MKFDKPERGARPCGTGLYTRLALARLSHADNLATALGLDMAQWWRPSRNAYLGGVSKTLILEAVSEGVSPDAADNLSGLKKEALIATAGERLAGTGWLLRAPAQVVDALAAA